MNKSSKIFLFLIAIFLANFGFAQAQENQLVLQVNQQCNVETSGESCVAELTLANNTGYVLDGEASLHIDYQGPCSSGQLMDFDGEGIEAQFYIDNWLNFSNWENGTTKASGFTIAKNETHPKLKVRTVPNLCPGDYTFLLEIKGTTEAGEEYTTPPVVSGGGGGSYSPSIPTTNTGEVVATSNEGGITTLTVLNQGQIKLIVPAGAVPDNTTFTIRRVDANSINQPDPGTGLFLINGLVYQITAERNGESITAFNRDLTLIFTYTDEQIEGTNESSLEIYWWNGTEWVGTGNSQVNANDNTVACSINHLTVFALLGSKTIPAEEESQEETSEETEFFETIQNIPERIAEEVQQFIEEIISPSTVEQAETIPASTEETAPLEETETPPGTMASLLAAIGMVGEEIGKSAFLTTVMILCLLTLAVIVVRELFLLWKKRKKA
jgi:hypothetical protein